MKKILYNATMLITMVALASCSENETNEFVTTTFSPIQESIEIRSYDEALQAAQDALSLLETNLVTRSDETRKISLTDNIVYSVESKTRAGENVIDTLFYVFNFEDNKGFAVISASKNTEAILAVTENGNYDPYIAKGIEGFDQYMDATKKYVQQSSRFEEPGFLTKDSLISITHQQQGPFVTVKWGQNYPEGEYFDNGVAGCTNTALAQIMSYYSYPSSIDLTYPNADISTQTLDWTSMKAHQTGHNISQCSNQEEDVHKSIGRLLRQLGEMNNSWPENNITKTLAEAFVKNTMQNLNYYTGSNFSDFDWNTIVNNLNSNHLLEINGGGHSWVTDGYIQTTYTYLRLIWGISITPGEWTPVGYVYEYDKLCHFNWGWYGNCDGYFSSGVFNTQLGDLYDGDNNTINANFNSGVDILPIWR